MHFLHNLCDIFEGVSECGSDVIRTMLTGVNVCIWVDVGFNVSLSCRAE